MIVIYITSESHSGSTLLALLLGGHSRICAGGELDALSTARRSRRAAAQHSGALPFLEKACMCGAPAVRACPLWSAVEADVRVRIGVGLDELDVDSADDERFARENIALFEALGAVAQSDVVLDSSKEIGRLQRLQRLPDLTVVPLHLSRSPYGAIFSQLKKQRPWLRATLHYVRGEWLRQSALANIPHHSLRYEQLAEAPAATLEQLMRALGYVFEPEQLAWARRNQHLIAGNHMRFSRGSRIAPDVAWRRELRWYQKATIALCTLPLVLRARREQRHAT